MDHVEQFHSTRFGPSQEAAPQRPAEQIVEAALGETYVRDAAELSRTLYQTLLEHLADVAVEQGSSEQHRQSASEYLGIWKEFLLSLQILVLTDSGRDDNTANEAIAGAVALMSLEPRREYDQLVRVVVEKLRKKYRL